MTNAITVNGIDYAFEDLREDLEGNNFEAGDTDSAQPVENPLAHVPVYQEGIDPEFQYERISTIAENLVASKHLSELTSNPVAINTAMQISSFALESDGTFSLKSVKDFFIKLLRSLITFSKAIWNKIRYQCKQFFASLMALVRNLDYMDSLFAELSGKVSGDYSHQATIVLGPELRYLTTVDGDLSTTELNLDLVRLHDLVKEIKNQVIPTLSEVSSTITRVVMENSDKNDPVVLLEAVMNALGGTQGKEQLDFLHVPVIDRHPLLKIANVSGTLSRQRSPYIDGGALASEPYLGGVRLYFKERSVGEKEKKSKNQSYALFNRAMAYQQLSVLFRRDGGKEIVDRRHSEVSITVNTDPRSVSATIKLAKDINKDFREVVKDRNINFIESQSRLIEKALERMGEVLEDPDYSSESMEALRVLTGFVSFMNNATTFPFQDLSILVGNVTNAVGIYSRKVFATYQKAGE